MHNDLPPSDQPTPTTHQTTIPSLSFHLTITSFHIHNIFHIYPIVYFIMSSANNNYMIDDLNDNQHALDTQLQALHQSLSETINATTTATNKLTLSNPSNSSSSSSNSAMIVASSLVMNQERTANLRHQLSSCRQLLRQNQMTYRMLSANMPTSHSLYATLLGMADRNGQHERIITYYANQLDELIAAATTAASQCSAQDNAVCARAVQNGSLASTKASKAVLNDTIALGSDSARKLAEQTERLEAIDQGIGQVQSNLKQANRQLRTLVRKLTNDKLILAFLFLIVLGIVGAIVVSIVKRHTVSSNSSNTGNSATVMPVPNNTFINTNPTSSSRKTHSSNGNTDHLLMRPEQQLLI